MLLHTGPPSTLGEHPIPEALNVFIRNELPNEQIPVVFIELPLLRGEDITVQSVAETQRRNTLAGLGRATGTALVRPSRKTVPCGGSAAAGENWCETLSAHFFYDRIQRIPLVPSQSGEVSRKAGTGPQQLCSQQRYRSIQE